jgi:hypothetical protein
VGYLGLFHNLAVVNSIAINMGVQVPLKEPVLHSFGFIPRNGFAGSYGRPRFRFLRSLHNFFQSGFTSLYSQQQWDEDSFFPTASPAPVVSVGFDDGDSNRGYMEY